MYLGIDYWTRNIGVAIAEIGIALPHTLYDHEEFHRAPELVKKRKVKTIVIGEQLDMMPTENKKRPFKKRLRELKTVPDVHIEIQDEDLTTFEAQESLGKLESDQHLDDIAASIILQRFIDKQ